MSDMDISRMTDKQLRNEVQMLRDELAVFKRRFEDMIFNLDSDNFGKSFTVEQNRMKAQLKIAADAIQVMVSDTDLNNELVSYAKTTWTADQIESVAKKADSQYSDLSTRITQTATDITAQVNAVSDSLSAYSTIAMTKDTITSMVSTEYLTDKLDGTYATSGSYTELYSKIEQTDNSISSIVSKNISAYFESTDNPTEANITDATKRTMLCLYDGEYYYFDDVTGGWKLYPACGLKTMFRQTAEGFELEGHVSLSGNVSLGSNTDTTAKKIVFSEGALIQTFSDGLGWPTGLELSGSTVKINSKLDVSECASIAWGLNAPTAVFG